MSAIQYICVVIFVFMLLRKVIATVLLLVFAASTFSRVFRVADYYVNTETYSKNCENKARPKLHCNGKCQMMKKLKQDEQKEQQAPDSKSSAKSETLSSRSFYQQQIFAVEPLIQEFSRTTAIGKPMDRAIPVFHPPGC